MLVCSTGASQDRRGADRTKISLALLSQRIASQSGGSMLHASSRATDNCEKEKSNNEHHNHRYRI